MITLACALVMHSGCTDSLVLDDEARDVVLVGLQHTVDTLDTSVQYLQETLDVERARLAVELPHTVASTIASLRGALDHMHAAVELIAVQITRLGETLTAAGRGTLVTLGALASQMQHGVRAAAGTIGKVAGEITRECAATRLVPERFCVFLEYGAWPAVTIHRHL